MFVLTNYKDITKVHIEILREIVQKHKNKNKELVITETYIGIYQRYIVEGNKKAIYDLPKEQRLFFIDNILKKGQSV